eukprot:Plantae.Rhodophyta-Rhodochaete_pulchella.ctg1454.p1 GENE.Plantae.Rhodophyta-Rhodochaete_pulchella.ctg1454~~Plantae.Rhodophyta-Rhodochaete_pulchella.ctg1454.p1  ORF type:complete len:182 (-),score=38.21 Plantae.Rhodophyta-Rhodochaete_pulchella.ctg1454:457-972(-)
MEANLRANYYYPTARKRYLPRIKVVADEIGGVEEMVHGGEWESVRDFAEGPAADAVGPLKLYASALAGQGLSLQGTFLASLEKYGTAYESQLQKMRKGIKKKDSKATLTALDGLNDSLQGYRRTAKIDTPDGGIGEVPTDLKVGSGFSNNNPALYERNFKKIQNKVGTTDL